MEARRRAAIVALVRRIKYEAMVVGARRRTSSVKRDVGTQTMVVAARRRTPSVKRDVGTQTRVTEDESEAGLPAVAPGGVGRDGAR